MNFQAFIGIDAAKKTLDVVLLKVKQPEVFHHLQIENNLSGYQKLLNWLEKHQVDPAKTFFVMEHSGWYSLELCTFLQSQQLTFTLVSALHLKLSSGITRGKSDRVDAKRIAEFAFTQKHKLKPTVLPSDCLLKLKNLFPFAIDW